MQPKRFVCHLIIFSAPLFLPAILRGQAANPAEKPSATRLKEQMRQPWSRSNERFIRRWLALSDIPLAPVTAAAADAKASSPPRASFDEDFLVVHGGEANIRPTPGMEHKLSNGSTVKWRQVVSWGDAVDLSDGAGLKSDLAGYAFATVQRPAAGSALLLIGSDESIRVWLNGRQVLDKRGPRSLTFDEDQVQADMKAGENTLLVKLEQRVGPWIFSARILEPGSVPARIQEIGPSLVELNPAALTVKTDIGTENAAQDKVTVQIVAAGGKIVTEKAAERGAMARFDGSRWPDGPYEIRCSTRRLNGLLYATHLAWYKGDAMAAARELITAGTKADLEKPEGFATKMLGDMVVDRLGGKIEMVRGNPWWAIHSPLMEFEEMKQGTRGLSARVRPYGFLRLAYRDEVDGSPQYCRVYLPGGYSSAKKWPLVVQLHGYNPANPEYVRWWAADSRHAMSDVEYAGHEGIIYMEPHGRGNTSYLGLGDHDVLRVIRLAKERLSIDGDRVYLKGDSMGGWGTWAVGTRHPDVFAAIAPIFGGADYHSQLSEEELARLTPAERFIQERASSFALADSLLHMPILVSHGDSDQSVNVEYSHYGIRLLERWGYNIRYHELPGYGHEDLNVTGDIVEWFLQHKRIADPRRVRIRSAELQNASAYWAKIEQATTPTDFMIVDAEIVGLNKIRLDSMNALAITLSPGPALIDPAKPVSVVWNGVGRTISSKDGKLLLRDPDYQPGVLEKTATVAGPVKDILNTPFAIIIGTASTDPRMNEMCRRKAEALIEFWRDWQRQPPRVFKDNELTEADVGRYSLILIGGADANLITRRMAAQLPLAISAGEIKIGGRSFRAPDSCMQMVHPNPMNEQRYVLVVAATSADGLLFWNPNDVRNGEIDFVIKDGRIADGNRPLPDEKVTVAAGWFDRQWKFQDSLARTGDPDVRAKCALLKPTLAIDPKILEAYVGRYTLPGAEVRVDVKNGRLAAQISNNPSPIELVPVSEDEFFIMEASVRILMVKDAAGKVVSFKGWQNGREFSAKKVE